MKAIVLSAGQGKRLLPLTERAPKCLLPVDGPHPILEVQLRTLARCGVERAVVVVGFGAREVERFLRRTPIPGLAVETLFNPFYSSTDNLVTCWLARTYMEGDFLLLNGDTLFEPRLLRRVLDESPGPVAVTVDRKERYDSDDMKVTADDSGRLLAIGKTLEPAAVNAESIGLLSFRDSGAGGFRSALERAIRQPTALRAWYLSVINGLAQDARVDTLSIQGLWWREVDSPDDLEEARRSFPRPADETPARLSAVGAS